jgi:hypothetical protein
MSAKDFEAIPASQLSVEFKDLTVIPLEEAAKSKQNENYLNLIPISNMLLGGELLELRLLKKSARHNFIIARHHSSNNIFSCHLLESSLSLEMNWIRAV